MIFLCALTLAVLPSEDEAKIYEDTVRLHILANSDSEYDQTVKLKIRDDILLTYGDTLKYMGEDASDFFLGHTEEIEEFVNGQLKAYALPYEARVTFSQEWYDTREYEDFTLPSGTYLSLVVHLGEGEGKNWWCVMYPPLCLDLATDAPADDALLNYNTGEQALIKNGKYNVKFKTLEFFSSLFHK